MAFLFAKTRPSPEKVPTDEVIPAHFLDDSDMFRSMLVEMSLRFDDVLDHEKLRLALVRLMEIGNWRKLGARLRIKDEFGLEYHVPTSYNEKRPGFVYSHLEYDVKISEHPIASKIPRATSRPSIVGNVVDFRPLTRALGGPKTIDDFLYSDHPQLYVKIVSFQDATLLSISWPHTFFDGMGMAVLFKNWIAVLEGREADVQPFHGYDLKGFSKFLFILRFLFDIIWHSKEECRVVRLPAQFVQDLKQSALEDLASENTPKKPFLSDGDIICAWWSRIVIDALRPASDTTVGIANAFSMRNILSKDLLPAGRAYVSNASMVVYTFIRGTDILTKPLSYVASKVRAGIALQGTREQAEAYNSIVRRSLAKTGKGPIFGDSNMIMVAFSNWSAAKFFAVDMSAAVVSQGLPDEKRTNAIGKPSYVNADGQIHGVFGRNGFPIMGKDGAGNYWLCGIVRSELWPKIEKSLAAL